MIVYGSCCSCLVSHCHVEILENVPYALIFWMHVKPDLLQSSSVKAIVSLVESKFWHPLYHFNRGHFIHETESPWPLITLQALSLVEKAEPVQVRYFTLCLRDQRSVWMQDGCMVYTDSDVASNGSCFMFTWTIFKNHFLEVGLT